MTGKEWTEGAMAQVFRRRIEGGSSFLWRLLQLTEGWSLVSDGVLWRMPSKKKNGSEFRMSVRLHSVLGCTGSYGNTLRKSLEN